MKKIYLLLILICVGLPGEAQHFTAKKTISHEEQLNNQYATGLFKSQDGTILDLTNDNTAANTYTNILQWMQGRVAGLYIYTNRYGTIVPVIRGSVAAVYVDEIPVDAGFLSLLPVTDIAMVKVIKTPFYGGFGGSGGAIAVYTLRGDEEE